MDVRWYRFLLVAVAISVVTHILALLATITLLAPGMAVENALSVRAEAVLSGIWSWRIGWHLWQWTTAANVAVAIALLGALRSTPRQSGGGWALAGLFCAVGGATIDFQGNLLMIKDLPALAQAGDLTRYGADEALGMLSVSTFAAVLYCIMTLFWIFAVARAAGGFARQRGLFILGIPTLTFFVFGAVRTAEIAAASQNGVWVGFDAVRAVNAIAFPAWMALLVWITAAVGAMHHRLRPVSDAPAHTVRWPRPGSLGALAAALANARGLRDLIRAGFGPFAITAMRSDINDVVYLNWCVPAERAQALLPHPLKVDVRDGQTLVSILTYQHGRFGPLLAGPLRRLFAPSPLQSNWRLYLAPETPSAPRDGIYFLKNAADMAIMIPCAKLFSDALPVHLGAAFTHAREGDTWTTLIDPGEGSAPDLRSTVKKTGEHQLPKAFADRFETPLEAIEYLVAQNRAVASHPAFETLHEALIDIPIDPADTIPVDVVGPIESDWLAALVEGCEPFAFVVPQVQFTALTERWCPGYTAPQDPEDP